MTCHLLYHQHGVARAVYDAVYARLVGQPPNPMLHRCYALLLLSASGGTVNGQENFQQSMSLLQEASLMDPDGKTFTFVTQHFITGSLVENPQDALAILNAAIVYFYIDVQFEKALYFFLIGLSHPGLSIHTRVLQSVSFFFKLFFLIFVFF